MKELSAIKLTEKNSRFYAYLYNIIKKENIESILKIHHKKYKKANHHCYSVYYKTVDDTLEIIKDDGEVGHPGKILLQLLKKHDLNQHMIVVSRIFGGKKLGIGGVSKAFKESGEMAIKYYLNQKITQK